MRFVTPSRVLPIAVLLGCVLAASVALVPAQASTLSSVRTETPSTVTDALSAGDPASASAIAQRFHHAVVDDSKTTETSQVSALPDGTMQLVLNTVPVRVRHADAWVPVNEKLTRESGMIVPTATPVLVQFSAGGSGTMAQVRTTTGAWVTESWPYGDLPAPTLSGATATYASVLPGVDLKLTAVVTGMSEVLVVKDATAAADPRIADLTIAIGGASVATTNGGTVVASAPDGSSLTSSSPTWWDSSRAGAGASGPAPGDSAMPVTHAVAANKMALKTQAIVGDTGVTYPLFIDPDWTGGIYNRWFTDRGYPNTSFPNPATRLKLGYASAAISTDNVTHLARTYWQVDTSGVEGKHVLAAHFNTTESYSSSCTPMGVELWWIGTTPAGSTWNNTSSAWISNMDTETVAYGRSGCPANAVGFSALQAVQAAAAANASLLTLGMKATAENDDRSYKEFSPSASLTIAYNTAPSTPFSPQMTSPQRSCGTSANPSYVNNSSQSLTLQVTITDSDGGAQVGAGFYLVHGDTLANISYFGTSSKASGSTFTDQIAANTLPPGLYAWQAIAGDGTDYSPGRSAYCYFQVLNGPVTPPTITTVTPATTVGAPLTVRFSDPSQHIVSYAYWWAYGSPSSTPPVAPVSTSGVGAANAVPCVGAPGVESWVCPDASGTSPLVTVAPVDTTSTLWVVGYDAAGNVSVARSVAVNAIGDTANVDYRAGHGWIFEVQPSPLPSIIADSNSIHEQDLSIGAGIDGTQTDTVNGIPSTPVLSFPGSGTSPGQVATAASAVDTTKSFTASAWVKPVGGGGAAQSRTIMSQSGGVNPGFTLEEVSGNILRFCVHSQIGTAAADCATATSTLPEGQWVFVAGIWDAINRQLRLLINEQIAPFAVGGHTVPAGDVSASGALVVGSATISGAVANQWNGLIDDPTIFPGVLDKFQLNNLYNQSAPQ